MKQFQLPTILNAILFFFLLNPNTFGQYLEEFSIPDKGILPGTCNGTFASCTSDFTGVTWTINGDFSGMDDGTIGNPDFFVTDGSGRLNADGDCDATVAPGICFETPVLDLSGAAGAVSFSIDLDWESWDVQDIANVAYQLDGGSWVQIAPLAGTNGPGTVDFNSDSNSGSGVASATGLSGGTLSIRVCILETNSFFDDLYIDNVSVPEAGVTILSSTPVVSISAVTSIIPENGSTNLIYRFSRTGDTSGTLPVNFGINGTASNSDFSVTIGGLVSYNSGAGTGTITFPANEMTVDLVVSSTGDLTIEADETVVVTILP